MVQSTEVDNNHAPSDSYLLTLQIDKNPDEGDENVVPPENDENSSNPNREVKEEINNEQQTNTLSIEFMPVDSDPLAIVVPPKRRNYFECEHCKKSFRKFPRSTYISFAGQQQLIKIINV